MSSTRPIVETEILGDQIASERGRPRPENRLLAALLSQGGERLRRGLEPVFLPYRQVLFEPDGPLGALYFPQDSVVAITYEFEDGTTAQMTTVGSEGVVPVPAILGSKRALDRHVVQVPGSAMRIKAPTLLGAVQDSPFRCQLLKAFVQAYISRALQSAACNALHSAEERCARWLLMTADSTGNDAFELTHDFLAELIGVHRPTVSVATRTLRDAGLIRCSRGKIEIVDRGGLERASCECYQVIRQKQEQLLGSSRA